MIRFFPGFIALAALGALAGCAPGEAVTLGVDVTPTGAATSSIITVGQGGTTTTTTGGAAVAPAVVNRVRLLVNDAKVQGGGSGRGCDGAESGPFVVDLSAGEIAKGAHREFSIGTVTPGTYQDAEIEIEPLHTDPRDTASSAGATSAELADFRTSGASLLVDGTFGGKAFQFAGHFKAEQGKEGAFTVTTGTALSIPMTVSPASWFVDASGKALDPTDAAQHNAIAVAICRQLDTETDTADTTSAGVAVGGRGRGGPAPQAHCVE